MLEDSGGAPITWLCASAPLPHAIKPIEAHAINKSRLFMFPPQTIPKPLQNRSVPADRDDSTTVHGFENTLVTSLKSILETGQPLETLLQRSTSKTEDMDTTDDFKPATVYTIYIASTPEKV
jgi:hypothetical protein